MSTLRSTVTGLSLSMAVVSAAVGLPGLSGCSGDESAPAGAAGQGGAPQDAGAESGEDATNEAAAESGGQDAAPECVVDAPDEAGVVATDRGAVRGEQDGTVWVWKGIPYVAPPVGELRWKQPEAHACWEDVRDATQYGSVCVQVDAKTNQPEGEEDCLTLNIWAPSGATPGAPLPVLFFIHGGGNIQGSSSESLAADKAIYDGRRLAETGGVVVVTINYRLGALGFLAIPELAAESAEGVSGNYGTLDQIAALGWVQRNITAFGGDPGKVTVFGESAGAVNTCTLVASPLAKGLFHGALMQSGGCTQADADQAEPAMSSRVDGTSCGGDAERLACLRALPAAQVLDELPGSIGVFSTEVAADPGKFGPIVDGWVLEDSPLDALAAGTHNHVPFVVGSNAEEMAKNLAANVATEAEYESLVQTMFGAFGAGTVATILAAYPATEYPTPQDALIALLTDMRFTCPARTIARNAAQGQQEPVFRYFFQRRATTAGGSVPASHGIELLYVFGTLEDIPLYNPAQDDLDLSSAMMGYWARLGKAGDPNGGGATPWPEYDSALDSHLVLDSSLSSATGVRTAQCDMWDSLLAANAP